MNHFATDNTLATAGSKLTLYFWLLYSFISSFPPLSDISTGDKKPMGGYHPEQFHGHLMCSSLSDHALTGDSSKDKKARQGTHFTPSLLFLPPSEQIQLSPPRASSLDSPYTTHVCPEYTFAWDGALCRRLSLSLAMFAHRRSQVVATHCTTWNPQSQADSP